VRVEYRCQEESSLPQTTSTKIIEVSVSLIEGGSDLPNGDEAPILRAKPRIYSDQRSVLMVTHDVEEALLLSDRVIVLSPRPATITTILDVPFVRPRTTEVATKPDFVEAKLQILRALHTN
jgi:hypothetical protein